MMKKPMILLAALLAFAAPAAAQEEPTPGEIAAVRELLEVSRTRENFIRAMELGMEQGGGAELTPAVRRALGAFMDEHFRYDDLEPDFISMYTELYTEEEIRGMTAFYRTPLGQRMVETLPELSARSQAIVGERLQAAMPELMEAVMEAMQEEEGETPESDDSR
jgi:uncharacterized protein